MTATETAALRLPIAETDWRATTFLDGLRGLAAFYVVVGHARYVLHEGNPEGFALFADQYSTLNKLLFYFFAAFRYGHEAVLFFFVLSGFVIHLRYARKFVTDGPAAEFGWSGYVYRRVRRLYPPLLLAIGLTFALDSFGVWLNFPIYFGQTPYSQLNAHFAADHGPIVLLGNLAFVMDVYVDAFGTNGPLWSLMYEWWFYMVFPLFWLIARRSLLTATLLMVGLWALTVTRLPWAWARDFPPLLLPTKVFGMMLIWWMGVLLAEVHSGRLRRIRFEWLAPLAGLVLPAILLHLPHVVLGLGFVGVIALGFTLQKHGLRLTPFNKLKPLGDMSYTLYVCHMPILAFMGGWLMSRHLEPTLPRHFGFVPLGILLALVFSWLAHFLVEKPFTGGGRKTAATKKPTN